MKNLLQGILPLLLLLCLHTALMGSCNHNSKKNSNQIHYKITIAEHDHLTAHVQICFIPKDSLLYMAQGAGQLADSWATFVHELKVTTANGKPIAVRDMDNAMWMLPYTPKEQITVNYKVQLEHPNYEWGGGLDGVAYATDWGVFYTARTLLIFNGDHWKDITVDFSLPKNWQVSTPWEKLGNSGKSFKVHNHTALMQSMIFAGTHEELSFKEGNFELVFALGGEQVLADKEEFKKLASGVLQYYIELMGGLPNPSPDNVLDKSLVIINVGDITDGEIIGSNISIIIEKDGDAMAKMISRFVFAHEFFHMWNGKSFMPDDQETEWFKEGFTNLYTLKALHHIGFLDDKAYFGVLNNLFYQRYRTDDGLGKLSMTKGEEKHAHWGLIYGGGLFVALAQDISIRKATENAKSVDDIMRAFYKRYGGTHDHYVIDDVEEIMSQLNGTDQSQFFNTYIRGTQTLPIAEYLSKAGLDAKVENNNLRIATKSGTTVLQEAMIQGLLGKVD